MKNLLLILSLFISTSVFCQNTQTVAYSDESRQYDTLYLVQQDILLQSFEFMQNSNFQPGDTLVFVTEPVGNSASIPEMRFWNTTVQIDSIFMFNLGYVRNYVSATEADVRALSDMSLANRDTTFRLVANSSVLVDDVYKPIQFGDLHLKVAIGNEIELNDFVAKSGAQTFFLNVTNLTSEGLSNWLENPTGLGLKNMQLSTFSIFPNPTSESLTIDLGDLSSNVMILNTAGKIVFQANISGKDQVDVSNFAKGLYAVSVNGTSKSFVKR